MKLNAGLIAHGSILAMLLLGAGCASGTMVNNNGKTGSGGKGGTSGGSQTGAGGMTVVTPPTGAGGGGPPVTTGGGGAGGTGVVQKLCATKTTIMNPVLINFDSYTGTVTADQYGTAYGGPTPNTGLGAAGPYAGPYAFGDGSATPMLMMGGGHPPSMWAVTESVMQAKTWGMGGGIWMTSCTNASAYKGITFWARGTAPSAVFQFSLSMDSTTMPDATNPAGGGTCPGTSTTCQPPTKTNIPLGTDWTPVTLMWADFTPGMSGTTAIVPNGDNITGIGWSVPLLYALDPSAMGDAGGPYTPVAADLRIDIDDIEFIP